MKILPEVLEGLKQKYGGAVSSKVGDGPEPLHNYLDVSFELWLHVVWRSRPFPPCSVTASMGLATSD